jgi:hypothetical protein
MAANIFKKNIKRVDHQGKTRQAQSSLSLLQSLTDDR